MFADDLYYASRPVTYLKVSYRSIDGNDHKVSVKISCSEELVLNKKGDGRACSQDVSISGLKGIRMGSGDQRVLWRSGDDVRIDWGYFYLSATGEAKTGSEVMFHDLYAVYAETELKNDALFLFAYDDIDSLIYFGKPCKAYWKKDGKTIETAIAEAAVEYDTLYKRACEKSEKLYYEALRKGGKEYAELIILAYRQVMAGHKLAVDENGELLYVSKECFSNGCAATVDVTYPSAPMYLYENTELLKGMLRPVMRYAASDEWKFDFAPHDVGTYPILNGQVYLDNKLEGQMPVEECGNIIILMAAICEKDGNTDFAEKYIDLLSEWNEYLVKYGSDPANQLCTDDFAGHLSHNCNLALKAIMGMAGFSMILSRMNRKEEADALIRQAREYAISWCERAKNSDGSYRLAFDRPETFSLKYNAIWDKVWGTGLFPKEMYEGEIARYKKEMLPYGVPLDSREKYTKADWLVWAAALSDNESDFEAIVHSLYEAMSTMRSRVPMTDWYYADTSEMCAFRHRTVMGGLFIKLLF